MDSSTDNRSPESSVSVAGGKSTNHRWAGVVCGEVAPISPSMSPPYNSIPVTPLENSDCSDDNAGKFDDANDWPALAKPTRSSPKSSVSISQALEIIQIEAQAKPNQSPKFNRNHTHRQRSFNRSGGNNGGFDQSGFNQPSPHPVPRLMGGGIGHQFRPNSSYRGGNFGPRPDRNGFNRNGHVGRPNQWTSPRAPTATNMHMSQRIIPPTTGFMRPTFRGFPPLMHMGFCNPMDFDTVNPNLYHPTFPSDLIFGGAPPIPAKPTTLPAQDPLSTLIEKQIDYYFSESNLVKDLFLRSNMDDHGLVPISLIANFPRVKKLTKNIPLILNSLSSSTVVEVQGDKVRKRNGWEKWILDSSSYMPIISTNNMVASSV